MFRSGSITWCSKKQNITALSTTEAENVATSSAARQAVWLKRLLDDLGEHSTEPTQILCNNKSAIFIAKNPAMHGRTKHIEIRFHFIRKLTFYGLINLKYSYTSDQVADIMTGRCSCKSMAISELYLPFAAFTHGGVLVLTES